MPPWTTSGLNPAPACSAISTAAAWARRLQGPVTKSSSRRAGRFWPLGRSKGTLGVIVGVGVGVGVLVFEGTEGAGIGTVGPLGRGSSPGVGDGVPQGRLGLVVDVEGQPQGTPGHGLGRLDQVPRRSGRRSTHGRTRWARRRPGRRHRRRAARHPRTRARTSTLPPARPPPPGVPPRSPALLASPPPPPGVPWLQTPSRGEVAERSATRDRPASVPSDRAAGTGRPGVSGCESGEVGQDGRLDRPGGYARRPEPVSKARSGESRRRPCGLRSAAGADLRREG